MFVFSFLFFNEIETIVYMYAGLSTLMCFMIKKKVKSRPPKLSNSLLLSNLSNFYTKNIRYQSYCANLARTYFVDAKPEVEAQYRAFVKMQEAMAAVREGDL